MLKPFLTYEQQLIKLRDEKHIVITDETETLCKLQQVGYYSLVSGYKHLFRIPAQKIYKNGTAFEELVSLYEFDEALRELFLHYLLHIERHIRSLLSYYFTEKYGEAQSTYLLKMNYNYVRKHQQGIDRLVYELQKLTLTTQHAYILHRQGYDGAVPIGAVEDDRTGQVPLACQLEDLRRIVADKQRRTLHGNQGIVLVKARQNGRSILLHDNGQLHVGTDGCKVHILACCLGQTGCRLLQHGQDVHIHRDLRGVSCGVKRNRVVHRRYLQIFANKKDPMGSCVTVSARCGAAVFSATHPEAG